MQRPASSSPVFGPGPMLALGLALAWSGGFGLPGLPQPWAAIAAAALLSSFLLARRPAPQPDSQPVARGWIASLSTALLLALIARSLGRVVIAVPAASPALAVILLGLWLGPKIAARGGARSRAAIAVTILVASSAAALGLGLQLEREGPGVRGVARSGPVIGIHPRQAVAVRIDGFGPHDLLIDDFVEPDGRRGYDPEALAARLELEL
ncbi:MAG: hypothetical protein KC431_28615, partial [Myxococcales bacterium]|nr:hypothetical protein [Myxococcales bacterium]